jgi:proline dehydrogenase
VEPLRSAILWAAGNAWLRRTVPRLPFARRAVRRFMPGETLDDALRAAQAFRNRGLPTTFTHLGENVTNRDEADAVVEHYLLVLDRIAALGLDTEISVKLTHLGFDLGRDVALGNYLRLVDAARAKGRWVWIDIESSPYVEGTLEIYRRGLEASPDVGLCLQAYLHRTPSDVADLARRGGSIRLVKGAYREPPELSLQRREDVSRAFVHVSRQILREVAEGRIRRFAAATHHLELLPRVREAAAGLGLGDDAFEVQMLYGIRQAEQFRLAASPTPVRSLIAYGPAWYAWYVRRLAERPANLWFVVRSLFARGPLPDAAEAPLGG